MRVLETLWKGLEPTLRIPKKSSQRMCVTKLSFKGSPRITEIERRRKVLSGRCDMSTDLKPEVIRE